MINEEISDQIKEEVAAIEEITVLLGLMEWPQARRWLLKDYSVRNRWGPQLTQEEREETIEHLEDDFREIYEDATSGLENPPSIIDSDVELKDLPTDDEIQRYKDEFQRSKYFQEVFGSIPNHLWSIKLVPIESLVAFQPLVTTTAHREIPTSEDGLLEILKYCLPYNVKNYLMVNQRVRPNNSANVQLVSRSPNVNLMAPEIGNIEDRPEGNISVTFDIKTRPNFVQVAHYRNRYILKNGYHRSYQLLLSGEDYIPAIVREVNNFKDTGAGAGWFNSDFLMGPRPPLVSDFLTDVSVELEAKASNKMIDISADKFDINI